MGFIRIRVQPASGLYALTDTFSPGFASSPGVIQIKPLRGSELLIGLTDLTELELFSQADFIKL